MMICKKKILILFLGLLSLICATPFHPITSLVAYFFGYPIFFYSAFLLEGKKKRGFYVYCVGVIYFLVQMRWMGFAQYHGDMIVYAYVLLCCLFTFNFFILGYFLPKNISQLTWTKILSLALIFSLCEYSRLWMVCGFPFHTTGLILTSQLSSLQLASVLGAYGLTFVVIAQGLNAVKSYSEGLLFRGFSVSFLPFVLGGIIYLLPVNKSEQKKEVTVAAVQTGLRVEQKWHLDGYDNKVISSKEQLKNIWDQIKELKGVDIIVFPEVTLPGDGTLKRYDRKQLHGILPDTLLELFSLDDKIAYVDIFSKLSLFLKADIMFGCTVKDKNAAFYFSEGKTIGRYNKRKLLPLGEYLPFAFLKKLAGKYGVEAFFTPGEEKKIIQGKCNVLPSICFDEGFPDDFLSYENGFADAHINISNDAWFVDSNLSSAHFHVSRLRSVENGIYSIRACNSGISTIISPRGEIRKMLLEKDGKGNLIKGVIIDSFPVYREKTIFFALGNKGLLFVLTCMIFFSMVVASYREGVKA